MLTNAEVWYGIQQSEIDQLEEVDKLLLRRVLGAPDSTCIESLYLELGLIPIRIIIKARRINYLHYLVQLKENEMLYVVFNTQWKFPAKDDWTTQVQKDLVDFKINMSLEEIKKKSYIHQVNFRPKIIFLRTNSILRVKIMFVSQLHGVLRI